jgi:predicted CopG family antitoxin
MVRTSRTIYIEHEALQKLLELKQKSGSSLGKIIENLIKEHEKLERESELKEKTVDQKIEELKNEIKEIKNIVLKIAKTWGVKLE